MKIDWVNKAHHIATKTTVRNNLVKLITLFIIPLLVFIYMASIQVDRLSNQAQQLSRLEQLTILSITLSALLHELQKERGYTAIYLTGRDKNFLNKLNRQQIFTHEKQRIVFDAMLTKKHLLTQAQFKQATRVFEQQLKNISHLRQRVNNADIDSLAAIEYYNTLNNKLLNLIANIVKMTVKTELTQVFISYMYLLKVKEMTGIERATLGVVFSKNYLTVSDYQQQIELTTAQALYQKELIFLASNDVKQSFQALKKSKPFTQVEAFHRIVQQQNNSHISQVSVKQWFNAITEKINQLQQIEHQISKELLRKSLQLKRLSLKNMAYWKITIILIVCTLSIAAAILIININHKNISSIIKANKKNQQLLNENRQLSRRNYQVQEQERKQLAADLHDQCGQQLTGMKLQADFISQYVSNNKTSEITALTKAADTIVNSSKQLINSIRVITNNLRPLILDQFGLAAAVNELISQWQQVMPTTSFTVNFACPSVIDDKLAIGCFRIIQEALTNACKHAKAENIHLSITLETHDETPTITNQSQLVMQIIDDGIGLSKSAATNGLGLISMRERAEALNGKFSLLSSVNQGVNIRVVLPKNI